MKQLPRIQGAASKEILIKTDAFVQRKGRVKYDTIRKDTMS